MVTPAIHRPPFFVDALFLVCWVLRDAVREVVRDVLFATVRGDLREAVDAPARWPVRSFLLFGFPAVMLRVPGFACERPFERRPSVRLCPWSGLLSPRLDAGSLRCGSGRSRGPGAREPEGMRPLRLRVAGLL